MTLLQGCASMLNGKYQKVKIITNNSNSSVLIDGKEIGKGKEIKTKVKRDGNAKQIEVQTPSYKPEYKALTQIRKSPLTILGLPLLYPILFDNGKKAYNYPKSIEVFPSTKIAKRDSTQKYLYLDKVSIELKKDSLTLAYSSEQAYLEDRISTNKRYVNDDIKVDYTIFEENITKILKEYNYIDTVKKIIKSQNNTLELSATIKKMDVNILYRRARLTGATFLVTKLDIEWNISDIFGQSLYTKRNKVKSGEFVFNKDKEESLSNSVQDAVNESLLSLIKTNEVKELMKYSKNKDSQTNVITQIPKPTVVVSNVADAIKATVTVLRDDEGHGSGFLISNNGYIITNMHVVANSKSIKVKLNDGTIHNATIVKKANEADLVLLKIEVNNVVSFDLDLFEKHEVGQDVFVVGTPKSIELGQTLSKGIISGIRTSDEREWIQTNISINFGNSGGPLITKEGKLIGVVNSKIVGFGVEGIAFSIPVPHVDEYLGVKY